VQVLFADQTKKLVGVMVPAIGMVRKRYDPAQTEIAPEYVVKSAKTADDFEARRFAEHLYYQLEGGAHRGESVKSPTFKHVFEEWKKSLAVDRKIRSEKYTEGNIRKIEIWALPHLGN
jgi:hypothetical protein